MEKYETYFSGKRFTIEETEFQDEKAEPVIWYYVYAWSGEKIESDYLQDTLEMAKLCAFEEFGIPTTDWKKIQ